MKSGKLPIYTPTSGRVLEYRTVGGKLRFFFRHDRVDSFPAPLRKSRRSAAADGRRADEATAGGAR